MKQRTDDWWNARRGQVGASRVYDVCTGGKGITRQNFMDELICLIVTGQKDNFTNQYIEWGIDQEPKARQMYEIVTGNDVAEVGWVCHPHLHRTGASPDGLVSDDGLLEIKCPASKTHQAFILNDKIAKKYIYQMQWQMECTGRKWCDFASYDPRFPDPLKIKIQRVNFDKELVEKITENVVTFVNELEEKLAHIRELQEKANASYKK